jgi:outer membrane protein OmpA-like peptidoglycan-associated protein
MALKNGDVGADPRPGRVAAFALAMLLGGALPGLAQGNPPAAGAEAQQTAEAPGYAAGEKVKLEGYVIRNDGQSIVVRDLGGKTTSVLLTDETSVKSKDPGLGVVRKGQKYAADALVPGLQVDVEGMAGADGRLVADKVRFGKKEMETAQAISAGVNPVEQQAAETAARVGDITNMDTKQEVTVNFGVNSAALSQEAKLALDDLATNAKPIKGYVIEVKGYTDSTGDAEHNLELSKRRAEAVVSYLQIQHDIPIRRIVTPAGYGATHAATDNTTEAGRAANRRVEVKLLVSKGLQPS